MACQRPAIGGLRREKARVESGCQQYWKSCSRLQPLRVPHPVARHRELAAVLMTRTGVQSQCPDPGCERPPSFGRRVAAFFRMASDGTDFRLIASAVATALNRAVKIVIVFASLVEGEPGANGRSMLFRSANHTPT